MKTIAQRLNPRFKTLILSIVLTIAGLAAAIAGAGITYKEVIDYMLNNGYKYVYGISPAGIDGIDRIVDTDRPYKTYIFVESENGIYIIIGHEDL
jgi:hypothetical protein